MKPSREGKNFCSIARLSMLAIFVSGCAGSDGGGRSPVGPVPYPIASNVQTTRDQTIVRGAKPAAPILLSDISLFKDAGYGTWTLGAGTDDGKRVDIMGLGYDATAITKRGRLLNFFTISDLHITDKESPSQPIQFAKLHPAATSAYSPVMLYTTHVLDAAMQTVNALHQKNPIDFGISLGDTCNNTQYNELRWYLDVIDGKVITPSSGAYAGADTIDYQKPYKAVGLDKSIQFYQALGNHDHFWIGTYPISDYLKQSYISDTIIALGDMFTSPTAMTERTYYMGVLNGSTPYGTIVGAGLAKDFSSAPKIVADPTRRSLSKKEWMGEFFHTTSQPVGHGFTQTNLDNDFASYSFQPKSTLPIKIIVLDDTQREDDANYNAYAHGSLDMERYNWLVNELEEGQADGQLMIIAAHIPINVEYTEDKLVYPPKSFVGWSDSLAYKTQTELIAKLQSYPNLLLWIAGHRHLNTVMAFPSPVAGHPENGFWQVETSSLRDFPQQFRTFEINLNSDYTVSIITTDVDPAVSTGTPAATARTYAIAAQQIANTSLDSNRNANPNFKAMPTITGSYNAELIKQLSVAMIEKMRSLCVP